LLFRKTISIKKIFNEYEKGGKKNNNNLKTYPDSDYDITSIIKKKLIKQI
jgi:hypothetical protein